MFRECSSLISLDLSDFSTSLVTSMDAMFYNCSSLFYLDLSNFNTSSTTILNNIFRGCSNLEYLNLKIAEINKQTNPLYIFKLVSPNLLLCSEKEDWGLFFTNNISVKCTNNSYTYKCYINDSWIFNNKYICENCGENYFMKYNDSNNNDSFINCYQPLKDYYLDKNESIYKLCYMTCKTCNIGGNEKEHN